jgi:phosphoribosylformylglycinamidine synthase subunit PurS
MSAQPAAPRFHFAVNVLPKEGILDPQGRAVEQSLPHLGLAGIEQSLPHLGLAGIEHVRVGRRVELFVRAADAAAARAVVDQLASELLSNQMIEQYAVEELPPAAAVGDGAGVGA